MRQAYIYTDTVTGKDIYYTKDSIFCIYTRYNNNKRKQESIYSYDKLEEGLERYYSLTQYMRDWKYFIHYPSIEAKLSGHEGEIIYRKRGVLTSKPIMELKNNLYVPKKRGVKTVGNFQVFISSYPLILIERINKLDKLSLGIPLSRFNVYLIKYVLAYFLALKDEEQKDIIRKGKQNYNLSRGYTSNEEDTLM